MPFYIYRVLLPGIEKERCPTIELQHSWKENPKHDPQTGYPLERVYSAPNLSRGYSQSHTKAILADQNIAKHGFTKYVRDPIANCYIKTAGEAGPATFSAK